MEYKKEQFHCPVEATLALVGGKYKPLILWYLRGRFTIWSCSGGFPKQPQRCSPSNFTAWKNAE